MRHGDRRKRSAEELERAVNDFAAAALLFAAKLGVYAGLGKKSFLQSAAAAWGIAEAMDRQRKGTETRAEAPGEPFEEESEKSEETAEKDSSEAPEGAPTEPSPPPSAASPD